MTVLEPNRPPRTVTMETKVLDRLFGDIDFDRVLEGARRADSASVPPSQRPGRSVSSTSASSSSASSARPEKIDYTAPEHFGQLHRVPASTTRKPASWAKNRDQAQPQPRIPGPPADRLRRPRRGQALLPLTSAPVRPAAGCRRQRARASPGASLRRNSMNSYVSAIRVPAGVAGVEHGDAVAQRPRPLLEHRLAGFIDGLVPGVVVHPVALAAAAGLALAADDRHLGEVAHRVGDGAGLSAAPRRARRP